MLRLRIVPLVAAATAALVVASACTSQHAKAGPAGTPTEGGTATFAESAGGKPDYIFPMLTPIHQSIANIEQFNRLSYRSLYWIGKDDQPVIDPTLSLAKDAVYSNGNTAVSVTLNNYNWSDGKPVTTRDVEFWINLFRANKTVAAGYIPGEFPDNIKKFTAVDDKTFTLQLTEPYSPQWFNYNELAQIAPIPQHVWDKTSAASAVGNFDRTDASAKQVYKFLDSQASDTASYGKNPLWQTVDGPWILSEYRSDGYSVFTPNKAYSGPNKPHLDKFIEQPFTSESTELNVIRSGKTIDYGYLPVQEIAQQNTLKNSGYTIAPWKSWGTNFIVLNFNQPTAGPLIKQLYIRQAMQSLINQPAYVSGPLRGTGSANLGPIQISSFLPSYDASKTWPYNPQKATSLLSSHGWTVTPNGTTTCAAPGTGSTQCGAGIAAGTKLQFSLEYSSGVVTLDQEMQAMKSDFSAAGISLNLNQAPFNTVLADAAPCKPGASKCTWQIINWGGGWIYGINPYPSGDQLFQTGAGSNYGGFSNPASDALISAAVHKNDPGALPAVANDLANQLPVLWTPSELYRISAISTRLAGVNTKQSPILSLTPEDWQITK
ncbi:MAG: peptide/nickel transport system substrate-binding protein [Pseudonocardiales bacterium]|nr:peptide/nickel transport system substrate-binding protein [Pseudonocardiales bacterium]